MTIPNTRSWSTLAHIATLLHKTLVFRIIKNRCRYWREVQNGDGMWVDIWFDVDFDVDFVLQVEEWSKHQAFDKGLCQICAGGMFFSEDICTTSEVCVNFLIRSNGVLSEQDQTW